MTSSEDDDNEKASGWETLATYYSSRGRDLPKEKTINVN